MSVGGRFVYPDALYLPGETSKALHSERFAIERALVEGYLARDKPVPGICVGTTLLCARMAPPTKSHQPRRCSRPPSPHGRLRNPDHLRRACSGWRPDRP
ncbi:gamma-glutamyl-gamma-aminobutyrate hydrolase family protein [Lichenihabitans psoromatis]|uniref:gamma-glutamyl-gamma-aminobutyrate hydrolase family protein n=1 Tax=Lichenihabitans psoromatis TaxID=2528642 RepID=UPI0013F16764